MTSDFNYKSAVLTLPEIESIQGRAASAFSNVSFFSPDEWQSADIFLEGPLSQNLGEDVVLTRFYLVGNLSRKIEPFTTFSGFLTEPQLAKHGDLVASITFRLKATKQTKSRCERVMVQRNPNTVYFGYSTNISEAPVRGRHFAEVISAANLPLAVSETEFGFRIENREKGELFTQGGDGLGNNIQFFKYGRRDGSIPEMLDRMKGVVQRYSDQIFGAAWSIDSGFTADNPHETSRLFEAVIARAYPAADTELYINYSLKRLQGIETLRNLGGSKSVFETSLCSFDLPNSETGEIRVLTSHKGHEIVVGLNDPDAIDLIKKALNLDFVPLK